MNYWKYKTVLGRTNIVYCIDGEEMGKYSAVHHMKENHNMSDSEAWEYINNLSHL